MSQQPPSDSEPPPGEDDPRPADEGAKYLSLLEPGSEHNIKLWEEFGRDIKRACLRMRSLAGEADDSAQNAVLITYQNLVKLRADGTNPWYHALSILRNLSREANRKLERERRAVSLTPSDNNEYLGDEEGEILHRLQGGAATAESAQDRMEREEDEKKRGVDHESQARFERSYEECLNAAIVGLPDKSERMLFEDYYSLKTHDPIARQKLVEAYHLSSYDNLQVKIHRITAKLVKAVDACMAQHGFLYSARLNQKQRLEMVRRYTQNFYRSE